MIDSPQPDETEKLVDLAQATGFFSTEEIRVVREMLTESYAPHPEGKQGAPGPDEYQWAVYRHAPGSPPLGFVCYGAVSMSEDVYDLYWIAVDPQHQSKKIGTALLEYVEDDLTKRRARQVYIETSDTERYTPTRAFYEKRGYAKAAHFSDFYHLGDGKVVYRKVFREK